MYVRFSAYEKIAESEWYFVNYINKYKWHMINVKPSTYPTNFPQTKMLLQNLSSKCANVCSCLNVLKPNIGNNKGNCDGLVQERHNWSYILLALTQGFRLKHTDTYMHQWIGLLLAEVNRFLRNLALLFRNHCPFIVIMDHKTAVFFFKNTFENSGHQMAAISFIGQCVTTPMASSLAFTDTFLSVA